MATSTLAYMYQLQNESYQTLSGTDFKVGVIDPDQAALTTSQVSGLMSSGKDVIAYLSIGEAEDYRSYWQSSWNTTKPSFILGENPDWPGNYEVKFWDPTWQQIIIDRAVALAKAGYGGLTLDVVDVYQDSTVAAAYHGTSDPRTEMMNFVGKISAATKAINSHFAIIQNNALDLLTVNPDDPTSATNTAYLSKIDGVTAETTFYMPDNSKTSWGSWNLQYLQHAVDAGKEVLAIDYPTTSTAQQDFINQAISHGFVPFVGARNLDSIPSVNYQIDSKLAANALDPLLGTTTTVTNPPPTTDPSTTTTYNTITGTSATETLNGTSGSDMMYGMGGTNTINGNGGNDEIHGGQYKDIITGGSGNDHLYGGGGTNNRFEYSTSAGNDVIHDFKNPGTTSGDMIDISHLVYATRAQVLSHITYSSSGTDAIIHLDGTNTITVLGVGHNLNAYDFHIT